MTSNEDVPAIAGAAPGHPVQAATLIATFAAALTAAVAAGCASQPPLPAGKFVTMACAGGKTFQARMSDDGRSLRVRAHHGSAELDRQSDGRYAGEGYVLNLGAEGGVALDHGGKAEARSCKPQA